MIDHMKVIKVAATNDNPPINCTSNDPFYSFSLAFLLKSSITTSFEAGKGIVSFSYSLADNQKYYLLAVLSK